MAGTNRPNGSQGQIKVTGASAQYVKAPNTPAKSAKPEVVKGGDLRARGSK
jgi:hypothetical protein